MVRQSREQIDAEIVDRACALFARHGYQHTSLQQVANEVGYSKAGLLHRFSSKEAIYRAALTAAQEKTDALLARISGYAEGAERDLALVEAILETTWEWPGVAAFLFSASHDPDVAGRELTEAGVAMAGAFGLDAEHFSEDRLIRMISASTGLHLAALQAARLERRREWRPLIVATAMDALGHGGEARPEGG